MALTSSVTAEAVAQRAGLRRDNAPDLDEAARCLAVALEELDLALSGAWRTPAATVVDDWVLRVAVDVARAAKVASASAGATTLEGGAARPVPRDPLAGVRAGLSRYVVNLG